MTPFEQGSSQAKPDRQVIRGRVDGGQGKKGVKVDYPHVQMILLNPDNPAPEYMWRLWVSLAPDDYEGEG
ncbi:hypothetical protein N7520_001302 [Penicillium odoratum]|uniref:uncharacterized protein n=1 Tax=Penicillium odoratum TaxID=1167516 RepID=UPI0025469DE6|nr:uncharacterized protein N7520_001302 [Penicillium odoratum]KAJ5778056.1 hypothetical protein N7520_001302 [Penicillium odoratum]